MKSKPQKRETSQPKKKSVKKTPPTKASSQDATPHSVNKNNMWGRTHNTHWGHTIQVFVLMMVSMLGTTYVWTACTNFQCEAMGPANKIS